MLAFAAALLIGAPLAGAEAAPTKAEQQAFIAAARQSASDYSRRLPDFSCTETVQRLVHAAGQSATAVDTVAFSVEYYGQVEHYEILSDAGWTKARRDELSGVVSSGDFGLNFQRVFDPEGKAEFEFVRWRKFRGRQAAVYAYRMPPAEGLYTLRWDGDQVQTSLQGGAVIDRETHAVLWISYVADPIPRNFPISYSQVSVEYNDTEIAGGRYLVPAKALVEVWMPMEKRTNVVVFDSYRKYAAEARITFKGIPR